MIFLAFLGAGWRLKDKSVDLLISKTNTHLAFGI